ncbi:cold shock-like protein CspA [mine drainage metagenome]|uniref:Cold shock-like protein CspA n=1 Tax=mine drainage metagenome TaxID=410659 RepID=A0A1J5SBE1_9ZZZZ
MRNQGVIAKWFDDKGYGFVSTDGVSEKIFAHISAFPKGSARPIVGEVISFEAVTDGKKGLQASNILYVNRPEDATAHIELTLSPPLHSHKKRASVYNQERKQLQKHAGYKGQNKTGGSNFLIILLVVVISYFVWNSYVKSDASISKIVQEIKQPVSTETTSIVEDEKMSFGSDVHSNNVFQCAGKSHCSEMTSCEEAIYYLKHCPGTIMDGDGDGLPCEDQWCGH